MKYELADGKECFLANDGVNPPLEKVQKVWRTQFVEDRNDDIRDFAHD